MSPRWSLAVLVLLTGCALPDLPGAEPGPSSAGPPPSLSALGEPKAEDTGAHYRRDDWGDWDYDPSTKCNTRERVLARDGTGLDVDSQCRPQCPSGKCWTSSYDGEVVGDAGDLQIDHIVPLAEANRSGARKWSAEQRGRFYNDMDNLIAVTGSSNQSKGDDDPGRWRPDRGAWCDYATKYVTVKARYKLSVDRAEQAELARMLDTC
ncbi:HNH endonuclease family protein [Actinokineospora guangxiensis]|uniref:HNH endonuclease family protein n=1 Tax=Actinokineospora guangxiensis TaxID=1490288 RepID=A0ABW0EZI6_9PSEU